MKTISGFAGLGFGLWLLSLQPGECFCNSPSDGNHAAMFNAASATAPAPGKYGALAEVIRAPRSLAKANPFRFSTKYQGDETDLLYYGYRYYNASTGRWISRDPIEESGGINVFAFVGNAPPDEVDDFGLCGGGGEDCSCGPDVTLYVHQTDNDIRQTFGSIKSKWRKRRACGRILGSVNSSWNWDVLWLQSTPNTGAKCSQCSLTFTYSGKCIQQYALWYFLYGVAADECTRAFPGFKSPDPIGVLAAGLIARMPISGDTWKQVHDKVEVAAHWYRSDRLSNQEPDCPVAIGREPARKPDPTRWRWKGIKWITDTE